MKFRFKLIVDLSSKNGNHSIVLPQSQNDFDKILNHIEISSEDESDYEILDIKCSSHMLNRYFNNACNLEELNFLAMILSSFSKFEITKYVDFLNTYSIMPTTKYMINVAYTFYNKNDLLSQDQKMYDGEFFPDIDFEENYMMKIRITSPGESGGMYIYLPAADTVIMRALKKLNVNSLNECNIYNCSFNKNYVSKYFAKLEKGQLEFLYNLDDAVNIPQQNINDFSSIINNLLITNEVYEHYYKSMHS